MRRTGFKQKLRKPLKRTPFKRKAKTLRVKGKATSSQLKDEIQNYLRAIAIGKYRGCVLRGVRDCGGEIGQCVLQGDHLVTRGNAASYADSRLVVALCKGCHGWKKWHKEEYDRLLREVLPEELVKLWDGVERDRYRKTSHKVAHDWKLELIALKQEAEKLGVDTDIGRVKLKDLDNK